MHPNTRIMLFVINFIPHLIIAMQIRCALYFLSAYLHRLYRWHRGVAVECRTCDGCQRQPSMRDALMYLKYSKQAILTICTRKASLWMWVKPVQKRI